MQVAPGMMVTANVRLERPLGRGAMGAVWVADHLTLRTKVAVKFISTELALSDPNVLARFTQEASVAAQIKSPHVVQTFDQGLMADGTPYIVMELLEGESLQEMIDHHGRLELGDAANILTQVARALNRAHEIGIVHRDIKPDNIFISPGDEGGIFCKILDFGIAKQTSLPKMGGLTNPGVMVGTPEYMSPEQVLSAKDVDYRADLWGLAVTMYHALTGELPFTAEALGTLCVKLLDGEYTKVTDLQPELPADLDVWFEKALAQEPEKRFESAREMADVFVRIVAVADGQDAAPLSGFTPRPGSAAMRRAQADAAAKLRALDHTRPLGPLDTTTALPEALAAEGLVTEALSEEAIAAAKAASGAKPSASPASPSPASLAFKAARSETLTGSSSNRRRDEPSSRWLALALGVGVLGLAGAAVFALVATPSESATHAADVEAGSATALVEPPTEPNDETPQEAPTAEASAVPETSAAPDSSAAPEGSTAAAPKTPPVVRTHPVPAPTPVPAAPPPPPGEVPKLDHGF